MWLQVAAGTSAVEGVPRTPLRQLNRLARVKEVVAKVNQNLLELEATSTTVLPTPDTEEMRSFVAFRADRA